MGELALKLYKLYHVIWRCGYVIGTFFPSDFIVILKANPVSVHVFLLNWERLILAAVPDSGLLPYIEWPVNEAHIKDTMSLYSYSVLRALTKNFWRANKTQPPFHIFIHAQSFNLATVDLWSILAIIFCWLYELPLTARLATSICGVFQLRILRRDLGR